LSVIDAALPTLPARASGAWRGLQTDAGSSSLSGIRWLSLLLRAEFANLRPESRNTNRRDRLKTLDLLIKIGCFVTKVNNVFNIKMS
jgi:hypothetical protein